MKKGKNKKRFKLKIAKIPKDEDIEKIKRELKKRYKDIDVDSEIDS